MPKTLFDKIWDAHTVQAIPDGPTQLYIDRLYCHEVTSPQAFDGLRRRALKVFRPERVVCMPDHNIPTINQHLPISDPFQQNKWLSWQPTLRNSDLRITTSDTPKTA